MKGLEVTLRDILPLTLLLAPELSGLEGQCPSFGGIDRQRCYTLR